MEAVAEFSAAEADGAVSRVATSSVAAPSEPSEPMPANRAMESPFPAIVSTLARRLLVIGDFNGIGLGVGLAGQDQSLVQIGLLEHVVDVHVDLAALH